MGSQVCLYRLYVLDRRRYFGHRNLIKPGDAMVLLNMFSRLLGLVDEV